MLSVFLSLTHFPSTEMFLTAGNLPSSLTTGQAVSKQTSLNWKIESQDQHLNNPLYTPQGYSHTHFTTINFWLQQPFCTLWYFAHVFLHLTLFGAPAALRRSGGVTDISAILTTTTVTGIISPLNSILLITNELQAGLDLPSRQSIPTSSLAQPYCTSFMSPNHLVFEFFLPLHISSFHFFQPNQHFIWPTRYIKSYPHLHRSCTLKFLWFHPL